MPFLLLYLFDAIYTAIHIFTWTLIRHRLPADAVLVLCARLAMLKIGQGLATTTWAARPLAGTYGMLLVGDSLVHRPRRRLTESRH